ncbi:conserved membrane hypothetical protein [Bradyrhizobium sp. STM 3843]|uniref:DUF898 family protein n=1 Tax=unclassified Bradyrhizobium TaxID=2631580 RepID=UPI000240A4D3|nr:DUF898 family protein [Bradyrhizobium sp. STM 3843]CCE05993.1 conserved membrane hypothetical protein [Bradyrhizobium sp. STM 3843]
MNFIPQPPPPLPAVPVTFDGERGEFFRLIGRGALLELVTLGFYRFWLATDIRRHLWVNTAVDGDAAEYTGRGKELLIGFLFAMAILVPIYLAYFIVSVEAERFKGFASVPLVIGFYAFGQFAIYRARRYRLTRTVWRGVRFWMDGSGWAYAGRAMLWALLLVLTLGLAFPWREAALERYKMQHSHYGNLQGDFEASPWELFKQIWWLWLAIPVCLVLFPLLPFIYGYFKAVEWRWWLSGLRFGGVRLQSRLRPGALYGLYWKVIGWFVLLWAVTFAYFGGVVVVAAKFGGVSMAGPKAAQALANNIPLLIMLVLGYIAVILAINVVMRMYLLRDVWARVLASVELHGIEAVANISAKGDLASALGEGFADGLDVAGF